MLKNNSLIFAFLSYSFPLIFCITANMHYCWVTFNTVGVFLTLTSRHQSCISCFMRNKMEMKNLIYKRFLPSIFLFSVTLWRTCDTITYLKIVCLLMYTDQQGTGWTRTGQFFPNKKRGWSNNWFGMLLVSLVIIWISVYFFGGSYTSWCLSLLICMQSR